MESKEKFISLQRLWGSCSFTWHTVSMSIFENLSHIWISKEDYAHFSINLLKHSHILEIPVGVFLSPADETLLDNQPIWAGVWFFTQNLSSCLVDCHIEAKEPWHSAWSDTQLKASTKREVLHVGRTKGGRKNGLIFFFFINILVSYTSSEIVHFAFPLHISSHCSQLYDGML